MPASVPSWFGGCFVMVVNRFCRSAGLRHIVPVLGRRLRWRGLIEWPRPSRTDSRPAVSVNGKDAVSDC